MGSINIFKPLYQAWAEFRKLRFSAKLFWRNISRNGFREMKIKVSLNAMLYIWAEFRKLWFSAKFFGEIFRKTGFAKWKKDVSLMSALYWAVLLINITPVPLGGDFMHNC